MGISNRTIEDRVLLKRAAEEACPKAFGEIYQKYQPFIKKYIAQKVQSKDESHDLVHNVFLRLYQGNCKYSGDSDVQGYLCGIAKKVLRDYYKAKKRRIRINTLDEAEVTDDLSNTHSYTVNPLGGMQRAENRRALKKAILNLPPKSRQAIELVHRHKGDLSKAAPMADCNLETLRKRHEYAIRLLKKKLRKLADQ